jgi:hypothetical protein
VNALGFVALLVYVFGFLAAFYFTVGWIARDETDQRQRGNRTSPDWVNGGAALAMALLWPAAVLVWALGRAYVLTARAAK